MRCFFLVVVLHHLAFKILVPPPRIKYGPLTWGHQVPTTELPRLSLYSVLLPFGERWLLDVFKLKNANQYTECLCVSASSPCPHLHPTTAHHTHTQTPWFLHSFVLLLLFSHQVTSNSLRPHGLQHARLPCPSHFPRACSNSCPLNQWCHPTISATVAFVSSCPQSFPVSETCSESALGGQSTRASASVLAMNIQGWFPLGLTGLISFLCSGLSKSLLQHHNL